MPEMTLLPIADPQIGAVGLSYAPIDLIKNRCRRDGGSIRPRLCTAGAAPRGVHGPDSQCTEKGSPGGSEASPETA